MGFIIWSVIGCIFHLIFWGNQFFGIKSLLFVLLWPFPVFWYSAVWILSVAVLILLVLILYDVFTKHRG